MLKPKYLNIILYIFIKYIVIFFLFMIKDNSYKLLQINNIRNGQDLFYYLWIVLFFPIIDIILFSIPIYFSFKIKNKLIFILSLLSIFGIEYFMNIYFTSQKAFDTDVILKVTIGVILLGIFFYKPIYSKLTES